MDIHIDLEDRSHSKHTCVVADRRWPFRTPASMVECGLGASLAWVLVSPIAYRCCQAVLFRRLGQGLLPKSSRAALAASASSQVQCNASLMFAEEVDVHSCPQDTRLVSLAQQAFQEGTGARLTKRVVFTGYASDKNVPKSTGRLLISDGSSEG